MPAGDSSIRVFHVQPEQAGQTLPSLLRGWLSGESWTAVQRLVRNRQIQVNGNLCLDAGRRLKANEVVRVLPHPAAPPPKETDVRVRYLDEHLIIVEKPSGMTSLRHYEERNWPQRRKQIQPTLDELLPRIIARVDPQRRRQHGPPVPVRAVHRIDRETSGLMVFARTVRAERGLGTQFRDHTIERLYLAVALGQVDEQTFDSVLVRDRGDGRRGSAHDEEEYGKRAVTHVRPVEHLSGYTLLECRLETGRTHQIRIHLAEAGHPLCGDKVYRQPKTGAPLPDRSNAPRLALHAAELGLVHPLTGERLHFSMPLPRDLQDFLQRLRGKSRAN